VTAGERAGARLVDEKEDLARAVTAALYLERPDLQAKYGNAGRDKCMQDMRYNLEHLAPAVALDEPSMFAGYARWLAGLLEARGIPADEVARSLALTRTVIDGRFPPDEAAAAVPALEAALAVLARP
jgi:MerR family transcriptional regulator, light-induced transcriptional regulator